MKNNYYPNDFIHGVLAAHCADETGSEAGKSKVKKGDSVKFTLENSLYQLLLKDKNLDLNKLMINWKAHKVIEDVNTGYLGIIYENIENKQIVLAHRSTNFELSLTTRNLFKQSGLQTDIESVLIGNIVEHQAYGFIATNQTMNYANEKNYSLSVTGHSLGAWLAELSVYYCNTVLDCRYVKGVTFDGPGSREMMEQMGDSDINSPNLNSLYIVSYLSAPNIVNCANKHLGQVYIINSELSATNFGEFITIAPFFFNF